MQAIRVGIDIVSVDRIRKVASRNECIFLDSVFGEHERNYFNGKTTHRKKWIYYAQHIAAKESVFKALGTGLRDAMKWRDVQVVYTELGPRLAISGETLKLFEQNQILGRWLSLGYTKDVAVALVVLTTEAEAHTY